MKRVAIVWVLAVSAAVGLCASKKPPMPRMAMPSTSAIVRLTDSKTGRTFCSGTVVSKHLVVTAAHCAIMDTPFGVFANPDIVITSDDGSKKAPAAVLKASPQTDQAVLEGDFSAFVPRAVETRPGVIADGYQHHALISCGYPGGGRLFCTPFMAMYPYDFAYAGHATLWPGMSGGPVIDLETGAVIGINHAVQGDMQLVVPTIEALVGIEQSKL